MPSRTEAHPMSEDERRRRIAAILAKGVIRWRKRARAARIAPTPESAESLENGLELPGETRLSVSESARGLRLRDDGDAG